MKKARKKSLPYSHIEGAKRNYPISTMEKARKKSRKKTRKKSLPYPHIKGAKRNYAIATMEKYHLRQIFTKRDYMKHAKGSTKDVLKGYNYYKRTLKQIYSGRYDRLRMQTYKKNYIKMLEGNGITDKRIINKIKYMRYNKLTKFAELTNNQFKLYYYNDGTLREDYQIQQLEDDIKSLLDIEDKYDNTSILYNIE